MKFCKNCYKEISDSSITGYCNSCYPKTDEAKKKNSEGGKKAHKEHPESYSKVKGCFSKDWQNEHPNWHKKCSDTLKEKYKSGEIIHQLKGKSLSDETKEKISKSMKKVAIEKAEQYSGRYNRGYVKYKEIDGFGLLGSWEELVYYELRKNNIIPKKPTGFTYLFHNKNKIYYPDFYIENLNIYIEVKGYETEKDKAKWSQFNEKLIVLKRKEINAIKNGKSILDYLVT